MEELIFGVNNIAAARSCPVMIEENRNLTTAGEAGFDVDGKAEEKGGGLYKITFKITNKTARIRKIKVVYEAQSSFIPEKYLIPCVNYDGNKWGLSNTPKGLTMDGQPWIFSYDRVGIPSCTFTENEKIGFGLFADWENELSLRSSCSLIKKDEGNFLHRIYWPVTEAPLSYTSKNILEERYDEFFTIKPEESLAFSLYAFACEPEMKNYGYAKLLDRVLDICDTAYKPCLTPDRVRELGIAYAKELLYDYKGYKMIITHVAPRIFRLQHPCKVRGEEMAKLLRDPYWTTPGKYDERFELGWADQGLLNSRMLAEYAHKTKDRELFDTAVGIFDAWCERQEQNGLTRTQFQQFFCEEGSFSSNFTDPDTCNLGWAAAEFTRMYGFLKSIGIEKPEYMRYSEKLCDFFAAHYSEEFGFGKSWSLDGEIKNKNGTVGGFMLLGMLVTYKELPKEQYLTCAKKAMDFYFSRDLDNFICTAGALDCGCIDKETAYPFIESGIALFEITGDKLYLERALKAAYYFSSWMFCYNPVYPPESEFTRFGYSCLGGTAISAEHHAIDSWGSAAVAPFVKLWKLTGNEKWLTRARLMWMNAIQGIHQGDDWKPHGYKWPAGGQCEGFFQTRFTKYRPTCEDRGHFNDCLSAWTGAYRMNSLNELEKSGDIVLF